MRATRTDTSSTSLLPLAVLHLGQLVFAAFLTFILGSLAFALGMRLLFLGQAYPGVSAAGIAMAGMDRMQVEVVLAEHLSYARSGTVLFTDGERQYPAKPIQVGLTIDTAAMADEVIGIGREGPFLRQIEDQLRAWGEGRTIPILARFDQSTAQGYLAQLAGQVDRPQIEASLNLDGVEVQMRNGQVGRELDIPATIADLTPAVTQLVDVHVPLVINETPPMVLDASDQAALARQIVSEPLVITAPDAGPWVFEPPALASMLRINLAPDAEQAHYQVGLDRAQLLAYLESLALQLVRQPVNARFMFNDDTRQLDLLQSAVRGRRLDVEASIESINQGLLAGQHEIPLVFEWRAPTVDDDATAQQLGISEPVSVVSTYFSGSSPERRQNIRTAAGAFHGLLIPPGGTLSMAEVLGDISLDNGYAEALIIFGGSTIKGVGGGVCQVSTTLFRTAFFGGYEIIERHPHAYRVSYYEQGPNSPGPGFDATVFVPDVDFKFRNDSQYWLLSETYVYGDQLLWKFYSTSDGRQVDWSSSGPKHVEEAKKPIYRENPDLPKGKIKQVEWEADGMDVVVHRTVSRDGALLHEDRIRTHYIPWRAVYEFGPGTDLPKNAKVEDD
jgi:vancomycin resistance protein YoaR